MYRDLYPITSPLHHLNIFNLSRNPRKNQTLYYKSIAYDLFHFMLYTQTKWFVFFIFFRSSNWTSRMVALMSNDYITREPFTVKAVVMHIVLTLLFYTLFYVYYIISCMLFIASPILHLAHLTHIAAWKRLRADHSV